MTEPTNCPFSVGQVVRYRPSLKGEGLAANDPAWTTPKSGAAVRIAAIERGKYVVCEGYDHPGGGTYWTEFSAD
jgi:hypothetical protein